jgi:hypothetical protein
MLIEQEARKKRKKKKGKKRKIPCEIRTQISLVASFASRWWQVWVTKSRSNLHRNYLFDITSLIDRQV